MEKQGICSGSHRNISLEAMGENEEKDALQLISGQSCIIKITRLGSIFFGKALASKSNRDFLIAKEELHSWSN